MKEIVAKLIRLANELDEKGLQQEADMVDNLIAEAIGEPRAFDIFGKGRVAVHAAALNAWSGTPKYPPTNAQVKVDLTLVVRPVENGQVQESKIVWNKQYAAHNIPEVESKIAADVANLKQHYAPATFDLQYEFYPVK